MRAFDRLAADQDRWRRPSNLGVHWHVRANRQSRSLAPGRILEPAQLDDAAGRGVAGRIEIEQAHMMGASIHAVDHGVPCSLKLVIETALDEPPDSAAWRLRRRMQSR